MKRYRHSWLLVVIDRPDSEQRFPASVHWMVGDGGKSKAKVLSSDGAYDVHGAADAAEAKQLGESMASEARSGLQDDDHMEYGFLVYHGRLIRGWRLRGPIEYRRNWRGFEYPVVVNGESIELTPAQLRKVARLGRA